MKNLYTAAPPATGARYYITIVVLAILSTVVQSTWISWLGLGGYGPDWTLILAVHVALRSELWSAVLMAFILGFIRDAVGGGFLGLSQFILIILTWGFYPFKSHFNFFNPLALMPLIFGLALAGNLVVLTPMMAALGWPIRDVSPASLFISSAISSALAAPLMFPLINFLTRPKDREDRA